MPLPQWFKESLLTPTGLHPGNNKQSVQLTL